MRYGHHQLDSDEGRIRGELASLSDRPSVISLSPPSMRILWTTGTVHRLSLETPRPLPQCDPTYPAVSERHGDQTHVSAVAGGQGVRDTGQVFRGGAGWRP